MSQSPHQWSFYRAGGFDQVRLETGADLLALKQLDQKLWVALGCPTTGLVFDEQTLACIDHDADGHIRANELLDAIDWIGNRLNDASFLVNQQAALPLNVIQSDDDEGAILLRAAHHVLKILGKPEQDCVTLEDVLTVENQIAQQRFNGDGVMPPEQIEDAGLAALVVAIMACVGGVEDASGQQGVNADLLALFVTQLNDYFAWLDAGRDLPLALPSAEETIACLSILQQVKEKIDDYFTRCQLASYDARAALPLNRSEEDYAGFAAELLSASHSEIMRFPLAHIAADRPLPLKVGLNPAWQALIQTFNARLVVPVLGERNELSEDEWLAICARFEVFAAWLANKPSGKIDSLSADMLDTLRTASFNESLTQLLAQDLAVASEVTAIRSLEKLLRYQRDLFQLCNNFVNFSSFYAQEKAIFQLGTLYLDGRSCDLCLRVDDIAKHATLAAVSNICLAYCTCTRGKETMNMVAAFTAGDSDFLMVGRNGVFYDRKGRDWDATIVRLQDNPISIRQAFWMPYKKLVKLIGDQIQKFAASKADAVDAKLTETASKVDTVTNAKPDAPKPVFDISKFAGIFAAIGLAFAAIGGALTSAATAVMALDMWQRPLAFIGLLLVISGPSMALAWFKLRTRSLAPVLDAAGWAINARARINVPFGTSLTSRAILPNNAKRLLNDPYAEKNIWLPVSLFVLALAAVGAWWFLK